MLKKKNIDMTQGPIVIPMILFALPMIGGSLCQLLYNTVDFIYVGNFVSSTAAGAVGASSSLITCLVGFFTGISVGSSVIIGRAIGAKDNERAERTLHTGVTFGIIFGIILLLVALFLAPSILRLLNTPETIIPQAVLYMRIYMVGLPFNIVYNMSTSGMRACGDSRTPFLILLICGILNVFWDALFVLIIPLGIAGVGIATVLSNVVSCIMAVFFTTRKGMMLRLHARKLGIDGGLLKEILHIGLPAAVQSIVITFSNVIVQYHINAFGETAVAAFSTYYKVENLIYIPIMAFGHCSTTFSSQNVGAKQYRRIRKGTLLIILIGVIVTLCIAGIILKFPNAVFSFFMKDASVVEVALMLAMVSFPFYWVYVFLEGFGGSVRAMGYSITSMIITIANVCALRITLLRIFSTTFNTVRSLAFVYPITWATSAACFAVAFIIVLRKRFKSDQMLQAAPDTE